MTHKFLYFEPISTIIRLMERYNWQQDDWPNFQFDAEPLRSDIENFACHAGNGAGLLEGLPDDLEADAVLDLMIAEAIETSEIEGESLQRVDVMSSIKNHLNLASTPLPVKEASADGVGQMTVLVRKEFRENLDETMLFDWHRALMKGRYDLVAGAWKVGDSAMQIVSGRIDRPTVHFEAPPSSRVDTEMEKFCVWFNGESQKLSGPVRAAVAHLYFESIHPFEDGNGRIGRAISEKALSQALGKPALLSLSKTINAKRKEYYSELQSAQQNNHIQRWVSWFVSLVLEAQIDAEEQLRFVLRKSKFLQKFEKRFNERQKKVVLRMFEAGPSGFEGGMNSRKYVALAKTSKATATRDLQELVRIGAFQQEGEGRSVRYGLLIL